MLVWSLVALAASVLAADRERAAGGAAGLSLAALGSLSLWVGAGTLDIERLSRTAMTAALPPWFLEASLALVGLGAGLVVWGVRSWLAAAAAVAVVAGLSPFLGVFSLPRMVAVAAGTGAGLFALASALGRVARRIPYQAPPAVALSSSGALPIAGAGLLGLLSPWPAGALLGGASAYLLAAMQATGRFPRRAFWVNGVLLLGALAVGALARSPASPDAPSLYLSGRHSILLAGLLLFPSAAGLGAWPLHRSAAGWMLVPAAIAVVARVGPEAVPLGLAWWLPLVFPLAIVGTVRGLLRGEWNSAAGSLAWLGLWIGTPESRAGALLIGAAGALAAGLAPARNVPDRILWAAAGVGTLLVFRGGITAEVVYTVVLAVAIGAALASTRVAGPRAPS